MSAAISEALSAHRVLPDIPAQRYLPGQGGTAHVKKLTRLKSSFACFGKFANIWPLKKHWKHTMSWQRQHHRHSTSDNHGSRSGQKTTNACASSLLFEKRSQSFSQHIQETPCVATSPSPPSLDETFSTMSSLASYGIDSPVHIVCALESSDGHRPGILIKKSASHHCMPRRHLFSPTPSDSPLPHLWRCVQHGQAQSTSVASDASLSASSSNATISAEDLTAKEFANIAGIKILAENAHRSVSQHDCPPGMASCAQCATTTDSKRMSKHFLPLEGTQCGFLCDEECGHWFGEQRLNIWDKAFWFKPDAKGTPSHDCPVHPLFATLDTAPEAVSTIDHHGRPACPEDTRRLERARHMMQHNTLCIRTTAAHHEPAQRNNYTIKKGRFEIHWELGSA